MKGRALLFSAVALLALAAAIAIRGWFARTSPPAAQAPSRAAVERPSEPPSNESAREPGAAPSIEPSREPTAASEPASAESLTICVVDDATGQPVAGARVTIVESRALTRALKAALTTVDTPAGRKLRREMEMSATTASSGCVEVAIPGLGLMLEARSGELWAVGVVNVVPTDRRVTLRLGPDRAMRVRAIDLAGNPVAGVPVALRLANPSGRGFTWKSTETEPPDGVATFFHFQRRLAQGPGWHAVLGFPVVDEPVVPVDASTPLDPPPTLVVPPAGALVVRVRDAAGGVPELDGVDLGLRAFAATGSELWPGGPWSQPILDRAGDARVPWIGLGLRVRAELRRGETLSAFGEVTGPTRAGESVDLDLVWDDDVPPPFALNGRFVFADGTPWPRATVDAMPVVFPGRATSDQVQSIEVGDDGRFRLVAPDSRAENASVSLRFWADHPRALGRVVAILPLDQDVPPEGLDLGDVVLDHGPPLASGRVVDEAGAAIADARVSIQAHTVVQGQEFWPGLQVSGLDVTAADGAFALHLRQGEPIPGGALRLRTRCAGFVTDADHAVSLGETDVVVVLRRAGAIAGSLVLADDLTAQDVVLVLDGAAKLNSGLREDREFTLGELAAGVYSLEIRVRGVGGSFDTAARVDDLIVVSGATCRDPRLQRLRVESPYETIEITVVDAASRPIAGASASIAGSRPGSRWPARADGVCRVRAERLPIDVDVTAFGFRSRRLVGVWDDARVVLEEGIAVRLRAGARASGSEPEFHLGLHLFEVDERGARQALLFADTFPIERKFFGASGELALRLPGPGVYDCMPWVYVPREDGVGSGGGVDLDPCPRITVVESASEQVFDLGVPQSAVDAAVAKALE